ncbi:hypothetical protein [Bradyrhizobium sp. Ai1a-2]|uniref:hypothetical protein n=1 Tax=Bradyrhizobium sp. Ai1a-2 TaxID=196490 RepID=UPI000482E7F7|nr:hypothetical protein [Bradyrhizobium sp. Ai1a-2]
MTESQKTSSVRRVKLSSLKSDSQKEREGDWIPALDIDPDIKWFVRSTNYAPFKIARDAHASKLARRHGDNVPDDVMADVYGKLAVEHLLLGWQGLVDDDERDIEFSPERAKEILTDPEYRAVRGSVYLAATKVGREEVEFVEAGTKN